MRGTVSVLLVLALGQFAGSATSAIRVKTDGNDANNGSTWALAKRTIQAAINVATIDPANREVWVKQGTYAERIILKSYVVLKGGYDGLDSTRTIQTSTINGQSRGTVVTVNNVSSAAAATIDGFIIMNGYARYGGGIACFSSTVTIINNEIGPNTAIYRGGGVYGCQSGITMTANNVTGNHAGTHGGGLFFQSCDASTPTTIDSNVFTSNIANTGGGIACGFVSSTTISRNTVEDNTAYCGGGIAPYWKCSASILNNAVYGNSASYGGGFYIYYSGPTVASCLIAKNTVTRAGGGVYIASYATPQILNDTIVENTAAYGGGISSLYRSTPRLVNTLIAYNEATSAGAAYKDATSTPNYSYCCYWANDTPQFYPIGSEPTVANHNFEGDPLFVDQPAENYRLTSGSPCRNTGDNSVVQVGWTDLDGWPRIWPVGGIVDIGCYEYH